MGATDASRFAMTELDISADHCNWKPMYKGTFRRSQAAKGLKVVLMLFIYYSSESFDEASPAEEWQNHGRRLAPTISARSSISSWRLVLNPRLTPFSVY